VPFSFSGDLSLISNPNISKMQDEKLPCGQQNISECDATISIVYIP
jgi:hypothetical protein